MRLLQFEIARFGLVGLTATVVHGSLLALFIEVGSLHVQVANVLAFVMAFAVSYLGHHRWTFCSGNTHGKAAVKFLVTAVIGFLANILIMELVVVQLSYHYLAGFICVVLSVPPATYIVSRSWIF